MKLKYVVSLLALASLIVTSICLVLPRSDAETEEGEKTLRSKTVTRDGKSRRVKRGPRTTRISVQSVVREKEKPKFDLEEEEEAKLTEAQRQLLAEIRKALDQDDKKTVLRLVQKLQSSKEWPDGIPKAIKMAAIDALGWFGSACLPEIAGFLADADSEVIESAVEKYEEALSDFDLSDRERSAILVAASQAINDAEAMDTMLFELNNMRHSVAVDTIKKIMASGGEAAKSALKENVEFYTGEENLDTPEKLDEWLKNNPDDEGDEEFYGASE